MKQLIRLGARLYPRRWRERYGVEFGVLLEELTPDLRTSIDILKGALVMQVTTWSLGKILAVSGLLGVFVAFAISFALPTKYASQAVVKISPELPASQPSDSLDRINTLSHVILSRAGLASMINRFSLYRAERSRMPIEEVVELMRKQVTIQPSTSVVDGSQRVPAFVIQFAYQDRFAAQKVTQDMLSQFIDENLRHAGAGSSMTLEMLDAASLPMNPISPNPIRMSGMGLALGLALGGIIGFFRKPAQADGVPVNALLEYLESDRTLAQFLNDFPAVSRESAVAALGRARL